MIVLVAQFELVLYVARNQYALVSELQCMRRFMGQLGDRQIQLLECGRPAVLRVVDVAPGCFCPGGARARLLCRELHIFIAPYF